MELFFYGGGTAAITIIDKKTVEKKSYRERWELFLQNTKTNYKPVIIKRGCTGRRKERATNETDWKPQKRQNYSGNLVDEKGGIKNQQSKAFGLCVCF